MSIILFGDNHANIFRESKNIHIYTFEEITITKLMNDNQIRRKIENIIKAHSLIEYVLFYYSYSEYTQINLYSSTIKRYVEWIANLFGKFKRAIILPEYPNGYLTNYIEKLSLHDEINYYELIYIFTKYINEHKLGNTLVPININRYLLDSNLLPKYECNIYDAFASELAANNINI